MTPKRKAKRGDLVVVRRIGGSGTMRTEPLVRWYVGRVTKVDREGFAREFEYPSIGGLQRQAIGGREGHGWGGGLDPNGVYIAGADEVDVPGVLGAVRQHVYPGHPTQPRPYDDFDEAASQVMLFRL